ncbi:MAG: ATP-binding protein [Candidatus Saganbacteria bacterium]|nr:ATP-binding protein [Candidatus Saganbacteria bacterium]
MLYPRKNLKKIYKVLGREESIILTGARQIGKTSLLMMIKEHLENQGQTCHYFNLENPTHLKALNEHPFNLFELIPAASKRQNIFIDEVQYLDDPTNFLKLLYDEKRTKIKIIASGSSAFYINEKFKDSLAGRKFIFEIFPLDFEEFLTFKKEEELLKQKKGRISAYYKNRLLKLWQQYLIYGGYPKVALEQDEEIKKILLEEIGSSYIKKDSTEAGIKNTDKYFALLKILAEQTGQLVNSQELSNSLNLAHKTIEDYLNVMARSYQIAFIKPFYQNLRKELTKMPKGYFYDTGLRNFFLSDFAPPQKRPDKGPFLENIVFGELLKERGNTDKIKFWRTQDKHEIDFVADKQAFEVKSDPKKIRANKYACFTQKYPQIKLAFLSWENILKQFYGWKI